MFSKDEIETRKNIKFMVNFPGFEKHTVSFKQAVDVCITNTRKKKPKEILFFIFIVKK